MTQCLVTTLKDSVIDSSLLKLGEMRFHSAWDTVTKLVVWPHSSGVKVKLSSPGYFTDADGISNLGTEMTANAGSNTLYLSGGSYDITITSKYLNGVFNLFKTNSTIVMPAEIDLYDFLGTPLDNLAIVTNKLVTPYDIAYLASPYNKANIRYTILDDANSGKIYGDIAKLADHAFESLEIVNAPSIYGNVGAFGSTASKRVVVHDNPQITGNLSSFAGNTSIDTLSVAGTKVTGNLSSLQGCTSLSYLSVSNTDIAGDTSALAPLTNLTYFYYTNCPNITGTWPLT